MNNLAWATKGWFSFGHRFENWHFAWGLLSLALLLPMGFLLGRTRSPFVVTLALSWIGFTTVGLMIAIQRISKIFDEVKRRPTYIRKSFIRDGQILPWDEHGND